MLGDMPVCPFCQTDLPMPNLPCPKCGRRMAEHPSLSEGKSYSVKPAVGGSPPVDSGVPELELSPRHSKPKAPARPPAAPSARVPAGMAAPAKAPSLPAPPNRSAAVRASGGGPVAIPGVGGAVFDEDDIFAPGGGNVPLELEMVAPRPPAGHPPQPHASGAYLADPRAPGATPPNAKASLKPGGNSARSLAAEPPLGTSAGRTGAMVHSPSSPAADEEAASFADYGPSPESWWQAPLYAYRVKMRQAELRRQLAERKADVARAKQAEEQAKLAFADRARSRAGSVESAARAIATIENAEQVMLQRDGALSSELEAHKARLAVIDERIAGLSAELAEAKGEERAVEEKLAEAEAIRQRAEAKLKRAEIEIRNAVSVSGSAAPPPREVSKRGGLS
jgi:hypothetical protein